MTAEHVYLVGGLITICGSYLRAAVVAGAALRTLANRRRFRRLQLGSVELLITPEPLLLAAVTSLLLFDFDPGDVSGPAAVAAAIGAVLVLYAWNLIAWSFLSWRSIFFGHGVQKGQQLVTDGAYGLVRHPAYLGAILVWAGLALAFLSPAGAAVTAIYVVPIYLLYMRTEEQMMREEFGAAYESYRRRVPMLVPYARLIPTLRSAGQR